MLLALAPASEGPLLGRLFSTTLSLPKYFLFLKVWLGLVLLIAHLFYLPETRQNKNGPLKAYLLCDKVLTCT